MYVIPVFFQDEIPTNINDKTLWIKTNNEASLWINNKWITIENFISDNFVYLLKEEPITFIANNEFKTLLYYYDEVNDVFVSPVVEEVVNDN